MSFRSTLLAYSLVLVSSAFAWNTPTQGTPTNGAVVWTGLTLDWSAVSASEAYQVQVDTSSAFNSPLLYSASKAYINNSGMNGDTQEPITDLRFGATYRWRVRAYVTGDTSAWSPTWTFNTRDDVTQTSPATGTETWTGTTLEWGVHVGVSFYEAQVDTSAGFSSPAFRSVSNAYINSTGGNFDTRWAISDLYFGKTYYWRVRARNTVDTCAWSPVWTFNTRDFVTLTAPSDGLLNVSTAGISLDWSPHPIVAQYQVQWDIVNLFNSAFLQIQNTTYINNTDGNADTQQATGALLPQQVYFWRVRAINAVDTSAWTTRSFSTGNTPIVLPSAPALIAPANASTVITATIDLVWSAVPDVGGYEYQISTLPDLSNAIPLLTGGTQVPYGPMTVGTTYYWRARSLQAGNASDWSVIWSFTYDPSTGLSSGSKAAFMLYPNPTADRITVRLPTDGTGEIILIDANGRIACATRATGPVVMMDLADLPSGVYWLRVSGARFARSVAVVKQ